MCSVDEHSTVSLMTYPSDVNFLNFNRDAQILASGSYLNDLWEWSLETNMWKNIGMNATSIPIARSNLGFTGVAGSLIVYGGMGPSGLLL